jgi:hypothetical protein
METLEVSSLTARNSMDSSLSTVLSCRPNKHVTLGGLVSLSIDNFINYKIEIVIMLHQVVLKVK